MSWRQKESLDKGSGGFGSLYKDNRKNVLQSAQNYKCQKCLQTGHFTYECTGDRKYVSRDSRTELLKRKMEGKDENGKKKKVSESSSTSSSSDSSSSSSDSSSSDSSSGEEEDVDTKKKKKKKSKKDKK